MIHSFFCLVKRFNRRVQTAVNDLWTQFEVKEENALNRMEAWRHRINQHIEQLSYRIAHSKPWHGLLGFPILPPLFLWTRSVFPEWALRQSHEDLRTYCLRLVKDGREPDKIPPSMSPLTYAVFVGIEFFLLPLRFLQMVLSLILAERITNQSLNARFSTRQFWFLMRLWANDCQNALGFESLRTMDDMGRRRKPITYESALFKGMETACHALYSCCSMCLLVLIHLLLIYFLPLAAVMKRHSLLSNRTKTYLSVLDALDKILAQEPFYLVEDDLLNNEVLSGEIYYGSTEHAELHSPEQEGLHSPHPATRAFYQLQRFVKTLEDSPNLAYAAWLNSAGIDQMGTSERSLFCASVYSSESDYSSLYFEHLSHLIHANLFNTSTHSFSYHTAASESIPFLLYDKTDPLNSIRAQRAKSVIQTLFPSHLWALKNTENDPFLLEAILRPELFGLHKKPLVFDFRSEHTLACLCPILSTVFGPGPESFSQFINQYSFNAAPSFLFVLISKRAFQWEGLEHLEVFERIELITPLLDTQILREALEKYALRLTERLSNNSFECLADGYALFSVIANARLEADALNRIIPTRAVERKRGQCL